MKSKLDGMNDLSKVDDAGYIVNNFLSCPGDKLDEFDTRQWATNYTLSGLSYVCESRVSIDEL